MQATSRPRIASVFCSVPQADKQIVVLNPIITIDSSAVLQQWGAVAKCSLPCVFEVSVLKIWVDVMVVHMSAEVELSFLFVLEPCTDTHTHTNNMRKYTCIHPFVYINSVYAQSYKFSVLWPFCSRV